MSTGAEHTAQQENFNEAKVVLTRSLHELGGESQLPVCARHCQRGDVPMRLGGFLFPAPRPTILCGMDAQHV